MSENRKLQVVQMNEAVAESVRNLVSPTVSNLPELSFEAVVTTGELDMLIASAQQVMKLEPTVDTQLADGQKVKVTRFSAQFVLDDKDHHIRFMQYRGKKKSDDVYVLFDMTESPEQIMVRDPNIFRLESGDDTVKGVYVHSGSTLPELNEREHVSFAEWVLEEIVHSNQVQKTEKDQLLQREKAQLIQQRDEAKRNNHYRHQRRWEKFKYYSPVFGLSAAFLGMFGLLGYIAAVQETPIEAFDKHHYKLEAGAVAHLGGTAIAPEFSFELLHSDKLEPEDVPEIGNTKDATGPNTDDGENRDERTNIDELRQFRLKTDGRDDVCETSYVNFESPNDKVKVWTDYLGNVRDFSVTVGNDTVRVCWNGPELKNEEMPRVVVQRQPTSAQ